jgi:hypothetical protein
VLKDEQLTQKQIEALRRMPPSKRLALAERLYWSAWKWKAVGVKAQHPDWSEQQVAQQVRRIFLNART